MALSKDKKNQVVSETSQLLNGSKLTVLARYSGTTVSDLQSLRKQSKDSGTTVRVIKNRLFKRAMSDAGSSFKIDDQTLSGQILYLFNESDEVAPAQEVARFAKNQPQVEFVAGITADGSLLSADDLKMLASLPSKEQLRGQLVGLINSPLQNTASVISANIKGVLNVLSSRADNLSKG